MRKPPTIESTATPNTTFGTSATGILTVLSVSPLAEDHLSLQAIIGHSKWLLLNANDRRSALPLLQNYEIAVVICERDVQPGTWINVLEHTKAMPTAPSVIVASRLADDQLWAEALNLGAWDVLAKPFERTEVLRSVKSGWQHWHNRATAANMMTAAS